MSTAILGASGGCQAVVVFIQPGIRQPKDKTKKKEKTKKKKNSQGADPRTSPKRALYRSQKLAIMPLFHLTLSGHFFEEPFLCYFIVPPCRRARCTDYTSFLTFLRVTCCIRDFFLGASVDASVRYARATSLIVLLFLVCLNLLLSFELRGSTWQLLTWFDCSGCLKPCYWISQAAKFSLFLLWDGLETAAWVKQITSPAVLAGPFL